MDIAAAVSVGLGIAGILASVFPESTKAILLSIVLPFVARGSARISGYWKSEFDLTLENGQVVQKVEFVLVKQVFHWVKVYPLNNDSKVRLKATLRDNRYLTGTWYHLAPGSAYHGAFQLVVDPLGAQMTGLWVGYSRTGSVNRGEWRWTRLQGTAPGAPEAAPAKGAGSNFLKIDSMDVDVATPSSVNGLDKPSDAVLKT